VVDPDLGAGRTARAILAHLPGEAREAITQRLRDAVAPYSTATGVELPGLVLLASARR
jgi:hypothetical protein